MKKCIGLILVLLFSVCCFSQVTVKQLLCENRNNPIGLDIPKPQLSWQLVSANRNCMQTGYEIRVAEEAADLVKAKNLLWETGKVESDQSVHVSYLGKSLLSGKKYYWQIKVWDNKGNVSAWSEPAFWQMGFLNVADWKVQWIKAGYNEDIYCDQVLYLEKPLPQQKKSN